MHDAPWAVVLAGGNGDRVSAITRDAEGRAVPKQFWRWDGQPPMVRWALARARRVAPAARVLVVVTEQHRPFWEDLLADVRRHNILVQPENRGTAAGALRALVEIHARRGGAAPVVLLPSDHYVEDEALLGVAMAGALRVVRRDRRRVMLFGVSPAGTEDGYGWILPETEGPVARVRQFVEKPGPQRLGELLRGGALINSFVLAARAHALLAVAGRIFPDMVRSFRQIAGKAPDAAARSLYARLPVIDLSRDVLEPAARSLAVVRVPPCGWSDLGTPERLSRFLERAHGGLGRMPAPAGAAAA